MKRYFPFLMLGGFLLSGATFDAATSITSENAKKTLPDKVRKRKTSPKSKKVADPSELNISTNEGTISFKEYTSGLYNDMRLSSQGISMEIFEKGLAGYLNLKQQGKVKKEVLTLIDFGKPSTANRMWVLDIKNKKVLNSTIVAHGKNTGGNYATNFSNQPSSHKSSLGFYVTAETYYGKHGLSLRMDGQDKNYNSNARNRAIVMHGADYCSRDFIKKYGRLGRSFGCPAVPMSVHKKIINNIKGGACLFIYHPKKNYNSSFLDEKGAQRCLRSDIN